MAILTLNAGSSSLKVSLWEEGRRRLAAQVERLGSDARLSVEYGDDSMSRDIGQADQAQALDAVLSELPDTRIEAVGHRIVHGGPDRTEPERLTEEVLRDLARLSPFAPLHQPHNLAGLRAARAAFPEALQVGCYDTAFHRGHPWVNDTFALPRRFYDEGVRRYGFHGLSYDFVTTLLARDYPDLHAGRVIVAHLGNGASTCAIREGRSIGSSMGFSALDGLPMGTRCGQIDPGVLLYLMDQKAMQPAEISRLLYKESGLKGLSGLSSDMRSLLASDAPEAAEAVSYFTFRLAREIGAMAAVLGGIDGLVFTGGIGENAAPVRAQALETLAFLGLELDPGANAANAREIHAGPVPILRIETDEESVIARACARILTSSG
ncbi:acetate/propionate family kinase [Histidinibacterium aquaticum]|uniref:Acetate kinase n=1 Tax=Histidinibacterium aquaticum TaxID=2613962 RepID=A0A5J5GSL8_9RHOB|nr:acetate/propionate family kinase [Histidinibacterium aquaticum]KAA9010608.1 acetate/propionate family kinase [Histidinibacterium aquaticum]